MEYSLSIHFKILIAIGLIAFLQCEKEAPPIPLKTPQFHRIYVFDAEEFLSTFNNNGVYFTGLKVKMEDNHPIFERVLYQDNKLNKLSTLNQPSFNLNWINEKNERIDLNVSMIDEYPIEFWDEKFDFTYFSWDEIELMALYSDQLYLSGAQIDLGTSIHSNHHSNSSKQYFTFKIEGDFNKDNQVKAAKRTLPLPLVSFADPCPPYWRPGGDG